MRCFYSESLSESKIELSPSEKRHIFSVNRFRFNEEILFIDGRGRIAKARIMKGDCFEILNIDKYPEPEIKLHLYVAQPRRQQMDQIIEQSAEIGIWSITPIISERSVSIPGKSSENERWKIKLVESCKQSHNPYLPIIKESLKINEAVNQVFELGYNSYFGAVDGLSQHRSKKIFKDIAWFVGPEGGFSQKEIEYMISKEVKPIKFGSYVMRVETAAITGASFLLNSEGY
ncbi:MAG TPA: hypothetical protein DD381_06765 [Lentisphaeria bacterium]|nr:MAG: hypothetical protein A2X47_13020 [Lentisphaerae bacterium GWF2_38_69]HBM16025.1 hypothetical protein [Lentisphaeria bacterium]